MYSIKKRKSYLFFCKIKNLRHSSPNMNVSYMHQKFETNTILVGRSKVKDKIIIFLHTIFYLKIFFLKMKYIIR